MSATTDSRAAAGAHGAAAAHWVANARMYSVSPEVAVLWRQLLSAIVAHAGVSAAVLDYPAPAPLADLWSRTDKAAVFMCGLPFSRTEPQPVLMAAPVPSGNEFQGLPQYWSDFVVREDSAFRTLEDTFGARIAFTVPDSQSGYLAALSHFMTLPPRATPLYREVIPPTITPLANMTAVVDDRADVAPIDAYALRLLRAFRPDLTAKIRVVANTAPTPIPPLVASLTIPALQAAFLDAHRVDSIKPLLDKLLLQGFARPDASAYGVLKERFTATMEYWRRHSIAASIHPAFQA
jgi:ABC transporter, phosphonate, periplasmic substrate-binding protein